MQDPNRKGTVERAIQHTQGTALKGRTFEAIDPQNRWLAHWEDHWAALRIHGRKKRQVLELFREEQPHLRPLPLEGFRCFTQGVRTVDDAGLVQIDGSYYAAGAAVLHSVVTVRVYAHAIEILDARGDVLRRHQKALRKGAFVMAPSDRLFNPSAVCARLLAAECVSYTAVKHALARRAATAPAVALPLTQSGPGIRALTEYQTFWEQHTTDTPPSDRTDAPTGVTP